MSSIGISPPKGAACDEVFGREEGPDQAVDGSCYSPSNGSPRASRDGMEDDEPAESNQEVRETNKMEELKDDSGSQTAMDDDNCTRAELQLQVLVEAVLPENRGTVSWADCTEFEVHPEPELVLNGEGIAVEMDCTMNECSTASLTCDQPLGPAEGEEEIAGACPQGVCGNVPKAQNLPRPSPQPTQAPSLQPNGFAKGPFTWSKVQYVPIERLSLEQWIDKDGLCIEPEIGSVNDNISRLDKAIVAKLMGCQISFPFLREELKRRWYHFGDFEIITVAANTFICLFQSVETREVLASGPWIVARNIIGMDKWTSTFSPSSMQGLHSPIWVCLPQLSLIYWDVNNITRIANGIGEPLWMDSHTSTWGRSSFARICVRIDFSQKLLPGVWINGIHGRFFQRIEYEGLTNFCFDCGHIGHATGKCSPKINGGGASPTSARAQDPNKAQPRDLPVSSHPLGSEQPARDGPLDREEQEKDSFGEWNLVTRKKKGKKKASSMLPTTGQSKETDQGSISQATKEIQHQMEEISNRIVNPSNSLSKNQKVAFNAIKPAQDSSPLTINLSKHNIRPLSRSWRSSCSSLGRLPHCPGKGGRTCKTTLAGTLSPLRNNETQHVYMS
ncbi:hypothetical protein MA16_Dca026766 [Dendrobium catenatum]|uniref:CCHC-type domain-containing protein n=1 Tax=Dendrobium catenatum TaxID=906689 RepID=A0A2I0W2M0_9ASPA|nr:hypothetical protein MA16_Dca026766 [Dendrobium catenatum]